MRIAILADLHGNPLALDAVLGDIQAAGGVDGYWLLGDYAALGFDPAGVIDRIAALPNVTAIRGNTDSGLTQPSYEPPTLEEIQDDPSELARQFEIAVSFVWTRGFVTGRGGFEWLAALPLEQRLTLPDGTRVLLVHASPGTDRGPGFKPDMPDDDMRARLGDPQADLVLTGHTHQPFDRTVDGIRVVNPGSVSNRLVADKRACYALLEADSEGYKIDLRQVSYDTKAVIDNLRRIKHPTESYLMHFFQP